MGDIADWLLASQDPFEDDEAEWGGSQPRNPRPPRCNRCGSAEVRCNRCGSAEVRWRQQGGKWVLFSLKPGVEHVCELSGDDFGVVE